VLPLYICSVQELFSWLIEVDGSVEDGDRGRIVFTLEYEMTRSRREVYAPVSNKAVAFVTFQRDNTLAVLPVVKVCMLTVYYCLQLPLLSPSMEQSITVSPAHRLVEFGRRLKTFVELVC